MIGVYLKLLNLPPYLRSKTENIKLVMLIRDKYINRFGWKEVLKNLISDLKILETEGITKIVDGEPTTYKGSLVIQNGDNIGAHQLGGFVENFSTYLYFCRFCEVSSTELEEDALAVKPLRTEKSYKKCLKLSAKLKETIKGVKFDSPLNLLYISMFANQACLHVLNPKK